MGTTHTMVVQWRTHCLFETTADRMIGKSPGVTPSNATPGRRAGMASRPRRAERSQTLDHGKHCEY